MLNVIPREEASGTEFHGKIPTFRWQHAIIGVSALGRIFVRLVQAPEPLHNL